MKENDCNKAIKIVTAIAIILFVFGASAIMERNQLQNGVVRKIEGKLLTIDTGTPDSQNWQAVDEAWVKHRKNKYYTVNFSFRQELERMIKTQYAPTTLQLKEIVCDRVPYDENCYLRYDIGVGGYWITVPKKYVDEW